MTEKKGKNHTKTLSLKPDERQEYETGGNLTFTDIGWREAVKRQMRTD
jgi:hypothetical protein